MNIIVVFKSRNQAMVFSSLLSQKNIFNRVINTPRSISTSCGLSVKVSKVQEGYVRKILMSDNFDSFSGIYVVNVW